MYLMMLLKSFKHMVLLSLVAAPVVVFTAASSIDERDEKQTARSESRIDQRESRSGARGFQFNNRQYDKRQTRYQSNQLQTDSVVEVPEPGVLPLVTLGLAGILLSRPRSRQHPINGQR